MKALKAVRDVDPTVDALDVVACDTLMKYLYVGSPRGVGMRVVCAFGDRRGGGWKV